jgi:hypothetical protein
MAISEDYPNTPGFLRGQITQPDLDKIKAPENIIQSVAGGKALYFQYRGEHLKRIDLYAQIEGLIAGNPPYNPAELAKHKLSHISNFNTLDARALYEKGALAYWNLLNEAETLVKFEIRPGKWMEKSAESRGEVNDKDPDLTHWSNIMAVHWDTTVRSWPSFSVAFNTLVGQLVKFGLSPALWPDERDWRWRTVELSRFFVEDQAQTDMSLITAVCVETVFTSQWLYQMYTQFEDVAKNAKGDNGSVSWDYDKCPWNFEELGALLVWIANQWAKTDQNFMDMMDLQRRIQNGDSNFNAIFSDSIRIVSLFYQEYDGSVSHYMFHPWYDNGNFLFFQSKQYKNMEEGIIIFTASPGEFTVHSNRGLGHKIFSGSQAMMQLDCSIIDMARMSATPIIQGMSTGSKDFEAIRFYPGVPTNIGTANFVQNQLGSNVPQLIQASQYMLGKMQVNTANSGDDPSVPDSSIGSISPTQARMQSYREFNVLKNNIAHFYSTLDRVVTNMTVKMLKSKRGYPGHEYVQEWKDKCIADGVPEELFSMGDTDLTGMPSHLKVRATRVAGDGSTLARILGLQELQPIASSFGPKQQKAYQREYVLATMGPEYVSTFGPSDDADETSGGASLAGVENAVMRAGQSAVFSTDNEHKAHFSTHMALAMNTIQMMQQQQLGPIEADKIFAVLLPHMGEHWAVLQRSIFAQSYVDQTREAWRQVEQYATLNRRNAAKQMQAEIKNRQEQEAKQNQVMTDEQLKTLQVTSDIERKNIAMAAKEQRSEEQNQTRAEMMREKIQTDAANNRLKINLEAQNKSLQAQQKDLEGKSTEELRSDLTVLNGQDPSPYNIEKVRR